MGQEERFANHTSDQGLATRTYKELSKFISNKTGQEEAFHRMNKHMKVCSALLVIRELQATVRHQYRPSRMAEVRAPNGKGARSWWKRSMPSNSGKQFGGFFIV